MKVALFVPCYVDQLFPRVAWASVAVLERLACAGSNDTSQPSRSSRATLAHATRGSSWST